MATEEMFTSLPTVATAQMSDIICAVQGYVSPSNLGLSVQESLQQVYNLFQSNIILFNAGNPNGVLAGNTYQFCWDTTNSILYICTTSGTTSSAVWTRANINSGYTTTATAASTTTLTVLSTYWQFFTGSTTQTLVMPVTSTLAAGMTWSIVNNSSGAVTVQSSGLNTITTVASGQVALVTCILNSGTTASSWNATVAAMGGGVTSITGTAHQVIASASTGNVTLSTPQNIDTTSSPTFASLTLTSPLTVGNGGTGVTSVTTSPTATSFAGWDANSNLSANNFNAGYATTVTAASTTTLTVASASQQYFTGTTTQTLVLPVVSTCALGQSWLVVNNSTGAVTVQSSGLNTISTLAGGTSARFTVISLTGTSAASWNSSYNEGELVIPVTVPQGGTGQTSLTAYGMVTGGTTSSGAVQQVATGTSGQLLQSGGSAALPTFTSTPTLGTPASGTLTNCTGLPVAGGGTGLSSATAYAVLCGGTTSTGAFQSIASVGTSGQVLTSNGAGALPTFQATSSAYKAPTVQKFTSGSGTYTTPTSPSPLYIRVYAQGGGGGGAGTGTSPGASSAGGNTTFGTTLIVANGGSGASGLTGAAGGSGSLGAAIGFAQTGMTGTWGSSVSSSTGAPGGTSFFPGAGPGNGAAAVTNSGSGGSGGSGGAGVTSGAGGGAGGFVDGIIASPSASYSYAVGGAGSGGSAGGSGNAGGNGAAGQIIVWEYYQ